MDYTLSGENIPFHVLLFLIAIIDILGGLLIIFNSVSALHVFLVYFGVIILAKGAWSVFSSFMARFFFDYLGWIDIISGAVLLLLYSDAGVSFLWISGIAVLIKGVWSILFSL